MGVLALDYALLPQWTLAAIATKTMVACFAAAVYVNHWVLVPRFWRNARCVCYGIALGFVMLTLTAVTLAINPLFYTVIFGPFPVKPWCVDYAIDLLGIVSHVAAAALVVWVVERLILRPDERR